MIIIELKQLLMHNSHLQLQVYTNLSSQITWFFCFQTPWSSKLVILPFFICFWLFVEVNHSHCSRVYIVKHWFLPSLLQIYSIVNVGPVSNLCPDEKSTICLVLAIQRMKLTSTSLLASERWITCPICHSLLYMHATKYETYKKAMHEMFF